MKINDIAKERLEAGYKMEQDYPAYCLDIETFEVKECFGVVTERIGEPTLAISFDPTPKKGSADGVYIRKMSPNTFWTDNLEDIMARQAVEIEKYKKELHEEIVSVESQRGKIVKNDKGSQAMNPGEGIFSVLKDILLGPEGSQERENFEKFHEQRMREQHGATE